MIQSLICCARINIAHGPARKTSLLLTAFEDRYLSCFCQNFREDNHVRAPIPQKRGVLVEGPYRGKHFEPSCNTRIVDSCAILQYVCNYMSFCMYN